MDAEDDTLPAVDASLAAVSGRRLRLLPCTELWRDEAREERREGAAE